jgi:DNA mismatch repair protein MutS2
VRDGEVELQVLGRRVRMPEAELEGARRPTARQRRAAEPAVALAPVAVVAPAGADVPYQLDLRGLRRDEALERLEQYLEDAASAGLPQARIVHGKGTGAIRQAVREHLRASPWVSRFAPELDASGGDGATAIWLS